jgi:glycosyltransferase involved in cell wall biosynthesis
MKICLFNRYDPNKILGGIETYLLYLARYLTEWGHEVTISYPRHSMDRFLVPIRRGMRLFKVDIKEMSDSFQLASEVARIDADIYHGQGQHPFGFSVLRRIGVGPKEPFLSTAHGTMWGTTKRIKSWCVHDKIIALNMERIVFNNSDEVICVSNCVKRELMEGYRTGSDNLTVIHNGVDPEMYPSKKLGRQTLDHDNDSFVITFFLRGGIRKGVDVAAKILRQLNSKLLASDSDVVIQAIADGRSANWLSPLTHNRSLKLYQNPEESMLRNLLSASDVFIFPTPHEGHSFLLLQAMAARNVVVASNIEPNKETIEHGVSGYVLDRTDIDAWTMCVIDLYENRKSLREIQENAVRRVRKEFHSETMCKKTLAVYESLL